MRLDEIKGIAFPFHFDPKTGGIAKVSGKEKLRQNLRQLLSTVIGERFMERSYGCAIRHLLHDPNNEALMTLVRYELQKAIVRWEPRIQVIAMGFNPHEAELEVSLDYTYAGEQERLEFRLDRL